MTSFHMTWVSYLTLLVFVIGYAFVIFESKLELQKSKPIMVAAGFSWMLVGLAYNLGYLDKEALDLSFNVLFTISDLFFFLLASMTFLNMLQALGLFHYIESLFFKWKLGSKSIYWILTLLSFVLSSFVNNLAIALLFGSVLMAMMLPSGRSVLTLSKDEKKYVLLTTLSLVVAINAGGVFSPFGDVTTLMIWQSHILQIQQFYPLIIPAFVNFIIPSVIFYLFLPKVVFKSPDVYKLTLTKGTGPVLTFFFIAMILAVVLRQVFHLPSVIGIMTGLGLMQVYLWYYMRYSKSFNLLRVQSSITTKAEAMHRLDVYKQMEKSEWDTLMFFFGILLLVGALEAFGFIGFATHYLYGVLHVSVANTLIGLFSSIVDNVPIMYAVIQGHPDMSLSGWQMITLTEAVGGSILAIGSAAGVTLMGKMQGIYTFSSHLKWSWVVFLGYFVSIMVQQWIS